MEGVGASVHHIDRGGIPGGCLYTVTRTVSASRTLANLLRVRESMWRPRRGGHVHAHVQEGKEGRREMLGPRAGGERITYNTRRVREVEEKGEAETGEVHRDPLQDRV